ncbi:WD40 repeat domain-containing protein [Nonomuraea sp. CA-143628]|uniref:WD40 repeat domain-containing protein n=1 Tax=Nonomuraea sp. CA-143628 TaxID=3239997 RepID=UPI003D945283
MSEWETPLLRTATLLVGDPSKAERITAIALLKHGDNKSAYFTLYRKARAERAVQVALHYDGWSEEDTADLTGLSVVKVRALAGEVPLEAAPEVDPSGLPRRKRLIRRHRRLVASACLLLAGAAVFTMLWPKHHLLEPEPATPRLSPVLAATTKTPIRYGLRVEDSFPEAPAPWNAFPGRSGCAVIDVTGARWRIPDADGLSGVEVSPDGHKLAYYSLSRHQVIVRDLTTGSVVPVPTDFTANTLRFSADGRYLAAQGPSELTLVIADTSTGELRRVAVPEQELQGWAGHQLVLDDGTTFRIGEHTIRDPFDGGGDVAASPDGRSMAVFPWEKNQIRLIDPATGRTIREIRPQLPPTAVMSRLYRWAGANEVVVFAPGYHSAAVYVVNLATGAARGVPYLPDMSSADLTIGAV